MLRFNRRAKRYPPFCQVRRLSIELLTPSGYCFFPLFQDPPVRPAGARKCDEPPPSETITVIASHPSLQSRGHVRPAPDAVEGYDCARSPQFLESKKKQQHYEYSSDLLRNTRRSARPISGHRQHKSKPIVTIHKAQTARTTQRSRGHQRKGNVDHPPIIFENRHAEVSQKSEKKKEKKKT